MATHGQLTIVNLTNDDLKVRANQHGKGPKVFNVSAQHTVRKTGIRIDRSDFPRNYSRTIRLYTKNENKKVHEKKHKYRLVLHHELILSVIKVDGKFVVNEITSIPSNIIETREHEFINGLKEIVSNGLDYSSDLDSEEKDELLDEDYE